MDRNIVYEGSIPQDVDILSPNKNVMIGLGMALQAIIGGSSYLPLVDGLSCIPTGPTSLDVLLGPGSIYEVENVDATAYGSLAADTTHQIVKQGINLGTLTLSCPAPTTTGFSINYLIEANYQDNDTGSTVLPYYNASNPAVAYNGPNNTGVSQNTVRQGELVVTVKPGIAATTGTQTTPSPDAGFTSLWVVTVAFGQTAITSGNISRISSVDSSPFILEKLKDKISKAKADTLYAPISGGSGSVYRAQLTANANYYVATTGNDSNPGTSGQPWLTIQHALNYVANNIDNAGFSVTINVADGTYAQALSINAPFVGGGSVLLIGNITTPSNCIISSPTVGAACLTASNGGAISIKGFQLTSTQNSSDGLVATTSGVIYVIGNMDFAGLSTSTATTHMFANVNGSIIIAGGITYSISGSASSHYDADNGSIYGSSFTVNLSGTPAFSQGFAFCGSCGSIRMVGVTFSGSATGPYYAITLNGVINTNGGGATYFPGSTSGSTATGGEYA